MPFPYETFAYLTPPQAKVERSAIALPRYEAKGWLAQVKKNGSHSVIFVDPKRHATVWNRHGEQLRKWQFTAATADLFRSLPGNKWFVFDGELLHKNNIKDTHYLYDMLVCEGIHLTGTTYAERYQLLLDILSYGRKPLRKMIDGDHYVMHNHVWVARNFTTGLREQFDRLTSWEDEGLVLRDPNGVYYTSNADRWMMKVKRA